MNSAAILPFGEFFRRQDGKSPQNPCKDSIDNAPLRNAPRAFYLIYE
jgi:hypothetical protein